MAPHKPSPSAREAPPVRVEASTSAVGEASQQAVAAAQLLAIESKVRAAKTERELLHLVADEMRKLVSARQVLVLRRVDAGRYDVVCVSSLPMLDRDTPFIRWVDTLAGEIVRQKGDAETVVFDLLAFTDREAAETKSYPFGHLVWQPMLLTSGGTFAAVLLARERPWTEQDTKLIARQSAVFGNMWQALHGANVLKAKRSIPRKTKLAIAAAATVAALFPIPMSTLAPVEIVAKEPQRVTAPIDGVIAEILVDPNRPVVKGQTILVFDETTAKSRMRIADQELLLAKARLDRTVQASFGNEQARHELSQAQTEFDLKSVERDYAAELLAKGRIIADRNGILVYADRDRLIGKPVRTGERLMQIVDPQRAAARIELPVADAIVLENGAKARLFLDADPLSAISARVTSHSYQAEPNSTLQLVYRLTADFEEPAPNAKIGARGTAQVQGRYVPMFYYLLRRPLRDCPNFGRTFASSRAPNPTARERG